MPAGDSGFVLNQTNLEAERWAFELVAKDLEEFFASVGLPDFRATFEPSRAHTRGEVPVVVQSSQSSDHITELSLSKVDLLAYPISKSARARVLHVIEGARQQVNRRSE